MNSWMQKHGSDAVGSVTTTIPIRMETSDTSSENDYFHKWKVPISKSFSSSFSRQLSGNSVDNSPQNSSDGESTAATPDSECPASKLQRSSAEAKTTIGIGGDYEDGQLIQILLPCIICNRTFSPEALERHSKVCNKVNLKTPHKPDRGVFESAEQRKKGTKAELFVPPPSLDSPTDPRFSCFSRGSKNRCSLRGTSCTTRSTLSSESLNLHQQNPVPNPKSTWRRQRSMSQTRGERASSKAPSNADYPYDDNSEFGSNSEESQPNGDPSLPSYAKPLAPTDECPYCNRCFGAKAFDRHVEFCQKKYVQRQYEIQPVPKEKLEAMERQEIRTKYRPMKGSSSCSSLRSMSPGKDFANMAYKLFGLRRSEGTGNLYNNQLQNFKKSNESLTNSCYGDYTRGIRRPSPSPARPLGMGNVMTNKINNLLSKTFQYGQQNSNKNNVLHPMKVNTSSNIPKLAKSSDNLLLSGRGSMYSHVPSSGYGQPSNNSFTRNSRSRSSLHKNFFRSKRVEPEGTENTSTMTNSSNPSSPLIITPMTFYPKSNKLDAPEMYRPKGATLLSQDPTYDPYEMAAKQLEELLKTQPIPKNVSGKKTARKMGLEKAFESVGVHSDSFASHNSQRGGSQGPKSMQNLGKNNEDAFVFDVGSGKMDDSYWDEVLRRNSTSITGKDKEQSQNQMLSASETKSQQSDSSVSDSSKSRAMSNISSADSGYGRSDPQDVEFETLETIVGARNSPAPSKARSNILTSIHSSLAKVAQSGRNSEKQENNENFPNSEVSRHFLSGNRNKAEVEIPSPAGARFCHECGNAYPSQLAKFCSECGEKRVFRPV